MTDRRLRGLESGKNNLDAFKIELKDQWLLTVRCNRPVSGGRTKKSEVRKSDSRLVQILVEQTFGRLLA